MKQIQLESFWHFPGRSSWDLQKLNLPWRWWNLPRPWWMHLKSCQQVGSHKKWMKIHHKDYMDHPPKETLIFWLSKQGELMIWPRKLEGCYHHVVLWQKMMVLSNQETIGIWNSRLGNLNQQNRWIYVYLHGFIIFSRNGNDVITWLYICQCREHPALSRVFNISTGVWSWCWWPPWKFKLPICDYKNHRGVTSNSCFCGLYH